LTPEALLHEVFRIEAALGRARPFPDAPRVIDIDLLLYGDRTVDRPELTLPHPRMRERGFVLRPLVEIAPDLKHPVSGVRFAELLERAEGLEHTERLFPGRCLLDDRASVSGVT